MPRDEVSLADAYAAALTEVGRLQERLIMGQALIASLKREVSDGQQGKSDPGNGCAGDSSLDFSD